jgi:hypothetical protein
MSFNPDDLIQPMTFAYVNTDKFVEEQVNKGDVVFVMAAQAFPVSEEDPYTQRIKLFVQLVHDDYIDTDGKVYVMDPTSLTNLDKEENDRLYKLAEERAQSVLN